jgi:hypothetical protein
MQSPSVFVWVCVFGISIMLHHIIASFRIALHHTSCCISSKTVQKESCFFQNIRWMKVCWSTKYTFGNYNLTRQENFRRNSIIQQLCYRRVFSLRSMKRREGVFSPKAQKWYVRKFHASQRKIHYIITHTDIQCLTRARILHFPIVTFFNYMKI